MFFAEGAIVCMLWSSGGRKGINTFRLRNKQVTGTWGKAIMVVSAAKSNTKNKKIKKQTNKTETILMSLCQEPISADTGCLSFGIVGWGLAEPSPGQWSPSAAGSPRFLLYS